MVPFSERVLVDGRRNDIHSVNLAIISALVTLAALCMSCEADSGAPAGPAAGGRNAENAGASGDNGLAERSWVGPPEVQPEVCPRELPVGILAQAENPAVGGPAAEARADPVARRVAPREQLAAMVPQVSVVRAARPRPRAGIL
jgi:hypothetical protein